MSSTSTGRHASFLWLLALAAGVGCSDGTSTNGADAETALQADEEDLYARSRVSLSPKAHSELCMQPDGSSRGSHLILAKCNGSAAQQWLLGSNRVTLAGGECLDMTDGNANNGVNPQIWDTVINNSNQHWLLHGTQIKLNGHNICLDVPDGKYEANTVLQVWECFANDQHQMWVKHAASSAPPSSNEGGSGASSTENGAGGNGGTGCNTEVIAVNSGHTGLQMGSLACASAKAWQMNAATIYGVSKVTDGIDLAVKANLNTIRYTNFLDEGSGGNAFDEARWVVVDQAIAQAASHGLKILLDLSTYRNQLVAKNINPYTSDWSKLLTFVATRRNTVTGQVYASDTTIAIISLAGEPAAPNFGAASATRPTTAQLTNFYDVATKKLRSLKVQALLSPGGLLFIGSNSGIDHQAIFALPNVDLPAIHVYSQGDIDVVPSVASYVASIPKPWLLEEFGVNQTAGDTARATYFGKIFSLAKTNHAAGICIWNFGTAVGGDTFDVNPQTPKTWNAVVTAVQARQ